MATFFERDLPVAATCHGTVLAARSRLTRHRLGDRQRTQAQTAPTGTISSPS